MLPLDVIKTSPGDERYMLHHISPVAHQKKTTQKAIDMTQFENIMSEKEKEYTAYTGKKHII